MEPKNKQKKIQKPSHIRQQYSALMIKYMLCKTAFNLHNKIYLKENNKI